MESVSEEIHGLKNFNSGEEEEVRKKAFDLCREYLNGAWRTVTIQDFVIKKVGGGLSNLLYFCQLPTGVKPVGEEPPCALLRIYGPTHDGENVLEAHFSECVVFTMLSEKESGPRLYGIFPGGRLEQYIPLLGCDLCDGAKTPNEQLIETASAPPLRTRFTHFFVSVSKGRPLTTDELLDDELSLLVAEAFARIHAMSVPLSKEPKYLWSTLFRWVTQIEQYLSEATVSEQNMGMVHTLLELDLRAEVQWLKRFLTSVRSPVVFSHNDLQEGNILLTKSQSGAKSIVLIDFEYCAYNYRAYDLANNLCETMYDYSNEEFPYFWAKPENFPSKEKQARFVERYLCKFHNTDTVSTEEIDRVLEEIQAFMLASHLFWAVWSVVTASSSTITFDYWGYGAARLSAYFDHKKTVLSSEDVHNADGSRCVKDTAALNIEKTLSATSLIETS